MRTNVPELVFPVREDFHTWLSENAETSAGVWLVFGKTAALITLSANDALEEALCFGWIDGQMQRIDDTKYRKYFAKRRVNSVWSEKNKKMVTVLRGRGLMTESGEKAVEAAKQNGQWDAPKAAPSETQAEEFAAKLVEFPLAYKNFCAMPHSVQRTYTRRYLSFKTEEARQRDFAKIVERLEQNLKPM